MVYQARSLDSVFHALSDPTRRAIVARLSEREHTVSELARPLPMSLPAVGKHLGVLERARLIERRRIGRVRHVRLDPAALGEAAAWLDVYRQLWNHQLDRLAIHLGEPPTTTEAASCPPPRNHKPRKRVHTNSASSDTSKRRRRGSSRRGPAPTS